jgi:glycosyltransferase involved in cell wall biosynthesis
MRSRKVLIVSDAWEPQVNGVVSTLKKTIEPLERWGDCVVTITPEDFNLRIPLPSYPEIKIALNVWSVGTMIQRHDPDAIHIATEGPIGLAARNFCTGHKIPFTTSYHTKFPEYVNKRWPLIPLEWGYKFVRWFHRDSERILVTTPSMQEELIANGFDNNIVVWNRGADLELFHPGWIDLQLNSKPLSSRPLRLVYVGRVSVEKNIEAFLDTIVPNYPNTEKYVVGDGPQKAELEAQYPGVSFLGMLKGEKLAWWYANADVMVFPSVTDTFGIVMIEANACGTPVAAFPVTGPKDFIIEGVNGSMDSCLGTAIQHALECDRGACRKHVEQYHTWEKATRTFSNALVNVR